MIEMNNDDIVIVTHTHTLAATLIVCSTTHNNCIFVINTTCSPWKHPTQFKTTQNQKCVQLESVLNVVNVIVKVS